MGFFLKNIYIYWCDILCFRSDVYLDLGWVYIFPDFLYVVILSWWILVIIYALTLLLNQYMFVNVHFLCLWSMWISLYDKFIAYNTRLGLHWSLWTGILLKYNDCLVGVGSFNFFDVAYFRSCLWWIISMSLWIHYPHLLGIIYCCVRWFIYCLWILTDIHMQITSVYKLVSDVVGWPRCMMCWPHQGDYLGLIHRCVWTWWSFHMVK